MTLRPLSFLLVFSFFFTASLSFAQAGRHKHDITFVVRKADKVKNIADRFHISVKELKTLNPHIGKNTVTYQGKTLRIPVYMKPRNKSAKETQAYNSLDYELDTDSLDTYIKEDFVSTADIEADTVRKAAIAREIKVVNKKISNLNARMDSIEADNLQNVGNKEAFKVQVDRARHRGNFAIGNEIDSLIAQKKMLNTERGKIDLRVADYDYLLENAAYMSTHPEQQEKEIIFNEPVPETTKTEVPKKKN